MLRSFGLAGVLLALVLFVVPATGLAAGTNPPPTGEVLNGTNIGPGPFSSAITCQGPTTGTLQFTISGTALGPYPGTFTETGTIEITDGVVTAFSASFTISSGTTTLQGTKSGPVVLRGTAQCDEPSPDFPLGTNFFHAGPFDATYQVTITGPLGTNQYTGSAAGDFNFTSGAFASGGMQEELQSAVQPPVLCDSDEAGAGVADEETNEEAAEVDCQQNETEPTQYEAERL